MYELLQTRLCGSSVVNPFEKSHSRSVCRPRRTVEKVDRRSHVVVANEDVDWLLVAFVTPELLTV